MEISLFENLQFFRFVQELCLVEMSHLLPEYRWVFLDGLLKVLSAENIGKKGVVDDKIELFGFTRFLFPILPFFLILIDALFQFIQYCLRCLVEFLFIEEPVLLDARLKVGQVRIALLLKLFSNFAQSPFEGLFFKLREINWNQLSERTRKLGQLPVLII